MVHKMIASSPKERAHVLLLRVLRRSREDIRLGMYSMGPWSVVLTIPRRFSHGANMELGSQAMPDVGILCKLENVTLDPVVYT